MDTHKSMAMNNLGNLVQVQTKSGLFEGYVEAVGETGMIIEPSKDITFSSPLKEVPEDLLNTENIEGEQFRRFRRRRRRRRRRIRRRRRFFFIPWFWFIGFGR